MTVIAGAVATVALPGLSAPLASSTGAARAPMAEPSDAATPGQRPNLAPSHWKDGRPRASAEEAVVVSCRGTEQPPPPPRKRLVLARRSRLIFPVAARRTQMGRHPPRYNRPRSRGAARRRSRRAPQRLAFWRTEDPRRRKRCEPRSRRRRLRIYHTISAVIQEGHDRTVHEPSGGSPGDGASHDGGY